MGAGAESELRDLMAVAGAYGALPGVIAVALGGSRTSGLADQRSDVDLYVYAAEPPSLPRRASVAYRFATVREIGNAFWEPGDEWINARTGQHVDVMYRTPGWIEDQLDRVLVHHEASTGYSTCFWHNVLHSRPLVDPDAWYSRLQHQARQPYPAPLRRAIVARNHPILRGAFSSYLRQIERAVRRGDAVSVQHRVTALLAGYFDILFAVNELPHPGEKRLVRFAIENCPRLPPGMKMNLDGLLALPTVPPTHEVVSRVDGLLDSLDALLEAEGLLAPDATDARETR